MTSQQEATAVRMEMVVTAPLQRAFQVFTEQFDQIKPRDHNLLDVEIAETVLEPFVGGHIYDRGVDGTECRWARILIFEPPYRIVFSWDISPTWELETNHERTSEVEISFSSEDPEHTLVELEHRNLDRHGADWKSERDSIASEQGWPLYLGRFEEALESTA